MENEIFVDTSGFYAMLSKNDPSHEKARSILREGAKKKRRFVTTDYVVDEISTLLLAKGHRHLIKPFFERMFASKAFRVEFTDSERFHHVKNHFIKHLDQGWSFTDCLSFLVMRSLKVTHVLTKDSHFAKAGFFVLLK